MCLFTPLTMDSYLQSNKPEIRVGGLIWNPLRLLFAPILLFDDFIACHTREKVEILRIDLKALLLKTSRVQPR